MALWYNVLVVEVQFERSGGDRIPGRCSKVDFSGLAEADSVVWAVDSMNKWTVLENGFGKPCHFRLCERCGFHG